MTAAPTRVMHCRRSPFDVYIGRPMPRAGLRGSKWANPLRIGRDGTRDEVIARYERWLLDQPDSSPPCRRYAPKVLGR